MITIFDTETSGVPDYKWALDDPRQPHIASVAAVSYTDDFQREVHSAHLYIKPDGWVMPEEAGRVNGLTTEFLMENGIDIEVALTVLDHLFFASRFVYAFNSKFDEKLYLIECARKQRHAWLDNNIRCAMFPFAAILKLQHPPEYSWKYPGEYKWPNLAQTFEFCFGQAMEKAHDGLADVRNTAAVLWHAHSNQWFDIFKL